MQMLGSLDGLRVMLFCPQAEQLLTLSRHFCPPVQLVDKSADLSMASQLFYKQARKANSCCRFM